MSKMILNKLVLLGTRYKRTLPFDTGLTIIRGDRTSGKSLVLSLIDYCFGKSESINLKVQKELAEHCDQVFLEIRIEDETFTLSRSLKQKQLKISIYFSEFDNIDGYIPKIVEIKEAMQILMGKLNIDEYKRTKYKAHSTEQELETISLRDIFRYVYISQHSLGTDNFLGNNATFKKNKNPYAFEMIFNLVESDKDLLNEQLVNAKNGIEARKREITGLNSYLEDKNAGDFGSLQSEVDTIQKEITKQKSQKEKILNEHSSGVISENNMYIKLKDRLTEIANQIFDYEKQKSDLSMSIYSKRFLVEEYEKEKSETDVTLEINYHLVVEDQKIECPLCHSAVNSLFHQENKPTQKVLKTIQRDIKNKMKLVNNLIEKDLNKMDEIDNIISSLKKEQEILNIAIGEFSKKTSVPFLSQIDSINSIINSHNKKKEIVEECIRIHRKIDEKNNLIDDLNAQIVRLEKDLKNLKVSEDRKKRIFDHLNDEYKAYMKRLNYNTKNTYIDFDNYTPYHDGASVFEHESGGLLECMQISFLAAILSSKDKGYAKGHPGFLLLDSISKYLGTIREDMDEEEKQNKNRINDPEVYEEIYKIFVELSANHQLIIVDNTPPNDYVKYSKYTFLSGEEGLVNQYVNEFKYIED
ncbi:coiled-coil domain-containing protein [Bacillus swezeyi]|uniref:Rad50/SbcC-type AAA domain-containing protein n=1 Tax=Bacillus swezeyi TaxID=1925020 RepID=A0A5M8RIC6_9BACI|nr:hypothetical protein [Bacillus swezeyi]KAA6447228.1 hypothetical protein DX927_22010 [Bacillus swezeyi]TYS32767.1 hypothetical protein FZC77_21295 [Bacillus swezeyi]